MKFTRRQTLAAALGSLGAGVLPRAQAQTQPFPSQVIKFVIPTPAGGDHDTMMRIIGQKRARRRRPFRGGRETIGRRA